VLARGLHPGPGRRWGTDQAMPGKAQAIWVAALSSPGHTLTIACSCNASANAFHRVETAPPDRIRGNAYLLLQAPDSIAKIPLVRLPGLPYPWMRSAWILTLGDGPGHPCRG